MNCTQAQARFAELLDDRIAEEDTVEVRAHLASCPDCQRDFSSLTQTQAAMDLLPVAKPSPRLRSNFYAMLEEEKNSAASIRAAVVRRHRAARRSLWRWILTPAAAAAIALVAFNLGTRFAPPANAPAPAPAVAATDDAAVKRELAERRSRVDSVGQLVG